MDILKLGIGTRVQQYITRINGTLTSFDVLFPNKEHRFVGDEGSGEQ